MSALKINMNRSYKIGLDEVEGLEAVLRTSFKPIVELLRDKMYWDETVDFRPVEYKSRDGFSAYSHNCGGLMIYEIIPECEQGEFGYLKFGEAKCEEDLENADGLLDAALRLLVKFEGINEDGEMEFYVNLSGGNGDAPYFRLKHLDDIYEGEFKAKSLKQVEKIAKKHVNKLLKLMK